MTTPRDREFMQRALELAEQARDVGEVPVGAVLVKDGSIVAEGWNQPISSGDPTAHAEVVALRNAAKSLNNYRLPGTTLYVTIEPCTMCVGAMVHARIGRIVFGARESRAGAIVSQLQLLEKNSYNHQIQWSGGVLEEPCSEIVKAFFRERR